MSSSLSSSSTHNVNVVNGFIVLGYAVTPLHPGVGRAPGAVDLPVQRDPMGYPIVFASSVKGALKAECGRRIKRNDECFNNGGRIRCEDNECALCCCLFGHEPGGAGPATGLLSVLDFIPLAFPVPSLDMGYVYVTTPYLARRALAILDSVKLPSELQDVKNFLESVAGLGLVAGGEAHGCLGTKKVSIGLEEISVKQLNSGSCNGLAILGNSLGGLARDISQRLIIVSDDKGPLYVEKGLIKVTRVRLNVSTKTVTEGALWTEEYIPSGAIFLGGFVATLPKRNMYCCISLGLSKDECEKDKRKSLVTRDKLAILLSKYREKIGTDTAYMIIGGKETIGRGLVKLKIYMSKEEVQTK